MTATRRRTRPRTLNPGADAASKVTTDMKAKAREFFTNNADKNVHDRKAKAARKELLKMMQDAGVDKFSFSTKHGQKNVSLDVEVDTPESMVVDVKKLKELVTDEQFMQIVGASQKAVTDTVGTVIATQCSSPVQGTTNVNVKASK